MYEYIRTKQTDIPKHGIIKKNNSCVPTHKVIQKQAIYDRDSYAGRNTKLGCYPIHEMGSVIQMSRCQNCGATLNQCRCGDYEEDDSDDSTYCENNHEQYLSPAKLRRNLEANGLSGEAHHIIPGHLVRDMNLDNGGKYKDEFNEAWNGIMLNGTINTFGTIIHRYKGKETVPTPYHRNGGRPCHDNYDIKIKKYIIEKLQFSYDKENAHTYEEVTSNIRKIIQVSQAECLDKI